MNPTCQANLDDENGGGGMPTVTTLTLAYQARERLPIPTPLIRTAPPRGTKALVHMPHWHWLAKSQATPRSKTARARDVWATATVQAFELTIDPGDGTDPYTCAAPGTRYTKTADPDHACTHTYATSGDYTVTVTASWAGDWHGSDGNAGTLPTMNVTTTFPLHVVESRSELVDDP